MTLIPEEILKEVFATLPAMEISNKLWTPVFGFGSKEEMLLFLNKESVEGRKPYPLVWLETKFSETGPYNGRRKEMSLRLVLATESSDKFTTEQRLDYVFKPILFPLKDNVLKALHQSGKTRILDKENNKITKYYNYGLKEVSDSSTNSDNKDVWDALKLECKLQLRESNCPIKITYKNT